jgi:Skp family chaperone for outer membrane proteins
VSEYVAENKITLVIDAQAVLWNDGEMNITEDVLNAFDAWYESQKAIELPQN